MLAVIRAAWLVAHLPTVTSSARLARSMIVTSGGRLMTGKMALRGILAGMVVHGEALLAQAGAATMRTVDTSRAAAQVLAAAAAVDATVIRAA